MAVPTQAVDETRSPNAQSVSTLPETLTSVPNLVRDGGVGESCVSKDLSSSSSRVDTAVGVSDGAGVHSTSEDLGAETPKAIPTPARDEPRSSDVLSNTSGDSNGADCTTRRPHVLRYMIYITTVV